MKDISNGELRYFDGEGGFILFDPEFRLTDRLGEHFKAQDNDTFNVAVDRFFYQKINFKIPEGVVDYEFVSEWSDDKNELLRFDFKGELIKENVPQKRFKYKVIGVSQVEFYTLCLFKESDGWKLAGIFRE